MGMPGIGRNQAPKTGAGVGGGGGTESAPWTVLAREEKGNADTGGRLPSELHLRFLILGS